MRMMSNDGNDWVLVGLVGSRYIAPFVLRQFPSERGRLVKCEIGL